MQKANWQNEGDRVNLTMPISKVDVEQRRVSGWASLDNIDQHRDLVDAMATREAFNAFRGNIREQHDEKKPVGRLVDFREDVYYDPETDKFYQGVYVTAYVSKGAQDTWEKVLDGTLSGFSIGGNVLESENDLDENGLPFRRVKKYMLTELSLVDNPANQLSNIDSIAKVIGVPTAEGESMTGDLATITVENVFVCNKCLDAGHGVHKSSDESLDCPICDSSMIRIGFVESSDPQPKETIKKMVDSHLADRKGGVTDTMANEEVTETVEVEEVQPVEEEEVTEAPAEETTEVDETEETVEVEEVEDPLASAVNSLRELTDRIESGHEAHKEEVRKSLSELDARFEERLGSLADQFKSLESRHEEFTKKFEGMGAELGEVKKGLAAVDDSTALRKSADSDQPAEEENSSNESFWKGSFLTID